MTLTDTTSDDFRMTFTEQMSFQREQERFRAQGGGQDKEREGRGERLIAYVKQLEVSMVHSAPRQQPRAREVGAVLGRSRELTGGSGTGLASKDDIINAQVILCCIVPVERFRLIELWEIML